MRTRRIAIGCRRTGWASTIAIAPSGLAGAPEPEFQTLDLTSQPDPGRPPSSPSSPAAHRTPPLPSRTPGTAQTGVHQVPTPSAPPPGEQDLTLADLTTGCRDLTWNTNPGWPTQIDIDWTRIGRGHTPRHARRLPAIPYRAFTWAGAGIITAVLLTVLVTMISELIR